MKTKFITILLLISFSSSIYSQTTFKTVRGSKTNYSISIPSDYYVLENRGNIDINYANSEGASINVVVKDLPEGVTEKDITEMSKLTNQQFINQLESGGIFNASVIDRGLIYINGVKSDFKCFKTDQLYYYSVMQFRKGKLICLTYTCSYDDRNNYIKTIKRVVNSLKT